MKKDRKVGVFRFLEDSGAQRRFGGHASQSITIQRCRLLKSKTTAAWLEFFSSLALDTID